MINTGKFVSIYWPHGTFVEPDGQMDAHISNLRQADRQTDRQTE